VDGSSSGSCSVEGFEDGAVKPSRSVAKETVG
jgi:hypothetical protein